MDNAFPRDPSPFVSAQPAYPGRLTPPEEEAQTQSAFIAIVGRPNVGKSSLLNAILGEKVAIVSSKPQTTRTRITGVLTRDNQQFVFIDTPGLHRPRSRLSSYMNQQAKESVGDVDTAVLVTEAFGPIHPAERELIESFARRKLPAVLVLNKIDLLQRKAMMAAKLEEMAKLYNFSAVVPLSAKKNQGLDILLSELTPFLAPSPFFFDRNALTDQPERVILAEILREKLLRCLFEEIPHGTAVMVEHMKERENQNLIDIRAEIICERDSHKGMIIGRHGSMLKKIASYAREDMEHFLGCQVHLTCWVKVKDDWRNREGIMRTMGYK